MKKGYILGIVLFLIGIMLIFNINYVSYSVYEHNNPELRLDMATSFRENTTLDGNVIIDFQGEIKADSLLEILVDDENYSINIEEMLDYLDISYEKTEDTKKLVNSSTSKLLTFESAGSKELAFKLPRDVVLDSLTMKITGASYNNVYPESVTLNFDGFIWKYLGDFNGWNSTFYFVEELEDSEVNQDTIVNGDSKYCVLLELPFSKNYRVYAEYSSENSSELKAGMYTNFNENLGECTLPSPSSVYQWNYCDVNLEDSYTGDTLVCISTNENGTYKLATGQVENEKTFRCDNDMNCESINFAAYFIKAQGGKYVFNSTSPITIQEDYDDLLLNAIQNSLGSCSYGDEVYCILPFKVELDTSGRIVLENLGIEYESMVYRLFYDFLEEESFIYSINSKDMDDVNITFPLSYFNITLDKGIHDLDIKFGGAEEDIRIKVSNESGEYTDIGNLIDSTNTLIDGLGSNEILSLLGYNFNSERSQLDSLISEFNNLKLSSEDNAVKENKANLIRTSLNNLRNSIDISISESKKIKDMFIAEPEDFNELDLDEDVYSQQENYNINFEAELIAIREGSNTGYYSLFRKTIQGSSYNVYEVIPKSLANDISIVRFKVQPDVIKADPIVKFSNVNEIVYFVEGDKVSEVYNTKTIIEPRETTDYDYSEDICGDGICGVMENKESCEEDCGGFNIPWFWVILIVIIFLIGLAYIFFYRGIFDLRKIGKRPIKSGKSLEALVNFISHSDMNKEELSKLLLTRGWTAEQIKYAFDEVEWRKRKVLVETPEKKKGNDALIKFIEKNLDAHVPLYRIKTSLLKKGWKEEQINEALKEIK